MAIDRVVESTRYPYLQVTFAARQQEHTVWAYIDTGFDGLLAIPEAEATTLGAPDRIATVRLADGGLVSSPVHLGSVQLLGLGRPVSGRIIVLGGEYILGRALIDRFRLTFDRGARLTAEA